MRPLRNRKKILIKSILAIFIFAFLGYFVQAQTIVKFDSVEVNQSQERIVRLSNTGDMLLEIKKIYLQEESANFSIDCDSSFSIEPDKSIDVKIEFTPQSEGELKSSLVIESNDPEKENVKIDLTGVGIKMTTTGMETFASGQPNEFKLEQNYPNPFNSSTTFKFQIAKTEEVKITIYSITGQKIKTIEKRKMDPGYYKVSWNGTNQSGQKVSSGVYMVRMQAGTFRKNVMLTYAK